MPWSLLASGCAGRSSVGFARGLGATVVAPSFPRARIPARVPGGVIGDLEVVPVSVEQSWGSRLLRRRGAAAPENAALVFCLKRPASHGLELNFHWRRPAPLPGALGD